MTNSSSYSTTQADLNDASQRQMLSEMLIAYSKDPMGGGEALDTSIASRSIQLIAERDYACAFFAWVDDKPAGFAIGFETIATFAAQPAINIHDLAVMPEFRGQGVSQRLLEAVEKYAKTRECYKVTLEVLSGNTVAQSAYTRFGFQPYQLAPEHGYAQFWQKILTEKN